MVEYIEKLYLETSVFGFFDDPLEINRDKRDSVQLLFEQISEGFFHGICSALTYAEIGKGPNADVRMALIEKHGIRIAAPAVKDVLELGGRYIQDGVISPAHETDAQHVAAATLIRVDVLVSLNLRHIVKTWRERQFNAVNLKLGYPMIRIATPEEVVRYAE